MPHAVWGHRSICQLSLIGACLGSQIVNTWHFEASAAMDPGTTSDAAMKVLAKDLADTWIAAKKVVYANMLPIDYSFQMIKSQIVERPGQFEHRLTPYELPVTGLGNAASGGLSVEDTSVTGNIKWRSPVAGKKHRGRSYIGPLPTGWRTNGLLASAGVTAYQAFVDAMIGTYGQTAIPLTGWALTIYSRPFNQGQYGYVKGSGADRVFHFPEDYAGDSTNVVEGSVDPVLRNQRRRQIGVGA